RDAQPVHGPRVGLDEIAPLELHRVEPDVLGDLFQVQLEGEARLWRAVTALGTARRLVGEHPAALESVRGDVVGHGLQRASIEGRGDAIRPVRAAVERALEVHRGDVSVRRDARADPHQHRMAAAMSVEDLLASERALDRPSGQHRELADDDLVRERVGLAAKAAALRRADASYSVYRP